VDWVESRSLLEPSPTMLYSSPVFEIWYEHQLYLQIFRYKENGQTQTPETIYLPSNIALTQWNPNEYYIIHSTGSLV